MKDAANHIGVCYGTIAEWARHGKIPWKRVKEYRGNWSGMIKYVDVMKAPAIHEGNQLKGKRGALVTNELREEEEFLPLNKTWKTRDFDYLHDALQFVKENVGEKVYVIYKE